MARTKVDKESQVLAVQKVIEKDPSIGLLNKHWQKFFAKFLEIETLKVSKWQEVHMLAYICKRYQEHFGYKFGIAIKGAPSKCPDLYMVKQIMASIGTTNMSTIKDYIDWTFNKKIIPNNVKFKKIGYFLTPGFVNEFQLDKKERSIIKRSTELPKEYKEIATQLGLEVSTYGDLAFVKLATDKAGNDYNNPYVQLFLNLEAVGFEPKTLERLAE